jgi:hypothetical protein
MLQGVSSALEAINDPLRYGEKFVANMAGSIVPRFVSTTAQAVDDKQRLVKDSSVIKSVENSITGGIPGIKGRESLPVRRNALGQPIKTRSAVRTFLDPFKASDDISESSPVVKELTRLNESGYNATPVRIDNTEKIGKVKLTLSAEQASDLQSTIGDNIYDSISNVLNKEWYGKLSDENKSSVISNISNEVKKIETLRFAIKNKMLNEKQTSLALYDIAKSKVNMAYLVNNNIKGENVVPSQRIASEKKKENIGNMPPNASILNYIENNPQ